MFGLNILLVISILFSLFEFLKGTETGFDLVLLALSMTSLSLLWGKFGLAKEGLVVGLIIFLAAKIGVRLVNKKIPKSPKGMTP